MQSKNAKIILSMLTGVSLGELISQGALEAIAELNAEARKDHSHIYLIVQGATDQSNKVTAIKTLRALLHCGLKEAKDMFEAAVGDPTLLNLAGNFRVGPFESHLSGAELLDLYTEAQRNYSTLCKVEIE